MNKSMTTEQARVAHWAAGPLLVLSVAGSGKTFTILRLVMRWLALGVLARDIKVCTFNVRAAEDLRRRAAELGVPSNVDFRTLNSLGWSIIGEVSSFASKNIKPEDRRDPVVMDPRSSKDTGIPSWRVRKVVRTTLGEWRDRVGPENIPKPAVVFSEIGCAKAALIWPEEWTAADGEVFPAYREWATSRERDPRMPREADIIADAYEALEAVMARPEGRDIPSPKRRMFPRALFGGSGRREPRAKVRGFSFDDQIAQPARWILEGRFKLLERFRNVVGRMVVDEAQDDNRAQDVLARWLAQDDERGRPNLVMVGDDQQCAPLGSMVLTPDGDVPIESLSDGSVVTAFDRRGKAVVGRSKGFSVKTGARVFRGKLVCVSCAGCSTRTTPNHRWLVRWTDRGDRRTTCVYLMRKGARYRVGWCQLFTGKGVFHLGQRCKIERADAVWVLGVFSDRTDASVYESIVAAKYGLPTATFEPVHGAQHLTREAIDRIFDGIGDVSLAVESCLRYHGRREDLPFWPPVGKRFGKMGRTTLFECYAANLLPELMAIPVQVGESRDVEYSFVQAIGRETYSGVVYSLDVDKHETYIQDGLITHNSIYAFRGARPELLADFRDSCGATVLQLSSNFRCAQRILDVGNNILDYAEGRLFDGQLLLGRGDDAAAGGTVTATEYHDPSEEAEGIAEGIAEAVANGVNPDEIAALFRLNAQTGPVEVELIKRGIRYKVAGSSFFERAEVRACLAWLALASGTADDCVDTFKRSATKPNRGLGAGFFRDHATLADARRTWASSSSRRGLYRVWREGLEGLFEHLDELSKFVANGELLDAVAYVARDIGVGAFFRDDSASDEDETDVDINLSALMACVEALGSLEAVMEMATDDETGVSDPTGRRTPAPRVALSTIHKSKGLEWEYVALPGWSDGLFPFVRSPEAEERRLAYVAVTRAKQHCHISWTFVNDKGDPCGPSAFVAQSGCEAVAQVCGEPHWPRKVWEVAEGSSDLEDGSLGGWGETL